MDGREGIKTPRIELSDLFDDIGQLKKRCAGLEFNNAVLKQTIEMLKKTPALTHRIWSRGEGDGDRALRNKLDASGLCGKLRSSYYYSKSAAQRSDPMPMRAFEYVPSSSGAA